MSSSATDTAPQNKIPPWVKSAFNYLRSWSVRVMSEACSAQGLKFLLLLAGCLLGFYLYKLTALGRAQNGDETCLLIGLGGAIAGLGVRMKDFIPPIRIALRTIMGLFTLYILCAYSTYDVTVHDGIAPKLLEPGRYLFSLIALGACFFPSLGLLALPYVIWFKKMGAAALHLTITPTDYMPLVDMGAFLIISGLSWHYLRDWKFWRSMETGDEKTLSTMEKLFLVAIASHMLNYFYSALAKVYIGDNLFSWIFHNKTHLLLLTSDSLQQLPIGFNSGLVNFSYEAMEKLIVPLNFVLFFGQLFSLIALLRIRWGMIAMLFYDLTHLVIFLTSGIFFYKWITLNLAIVAALRTMQKKEVTPMIGLLTIATVILGSHLFFTARLGWWDTPAHNIEYMSAVTKDGRDIRIPSNYWGNMSVTAAQQRLIWGKSDGFLPTSTYGITMSQRTMELAATCDLPLDTKKTSSARAYFKNPDNDLRKFVRAYHPWAVKHAGEDGKFIYLLFPHHIFSLPWYYTEFSNLNLNDIVAYRYNLRATCLQYENGRIVPRLLKEEHYDIPLR